MPARHRRGPGLAPLIHSLADDKDKSGKGRVGPLGRYWAGNAVDDQTAHSGLAGMRGQLLPLKLAMSFTGASMAAQTLLLLGVGQPGGAAVAAGIAAMFASVGLFLPRFLFHRVHAKPLAAREVETLLPTARDELDRAYLTLILDVIAQPAATIPEETQAELRKAIGALGEAIEQMPAAAAQGVVSEGSDEGGSVETLRQEARRVRAEAVAERDEISQSSLERQADALERRADALARSSTLVRRAFLLRREMRAQIEALRAGLVGFSTGASDIAGLGSLAESVRSVAAEASGIAEARAELENGPVLAAPTGYAAAREAPAEETVPLRRQGRGG